MPVEYEKTIFGNWISKYECPRCDTRLNSNLSDAGIVDTCPECGAKFRVPGVRRLKQLSQERKQVQADRQLRLEEKAQRRLEEKVEGQNTAKELQQIEFEKKEVSLQQERTSPQLIVPNSARTSNDLEAIVVGVGAGGFAAIFGSGALAALATTCFGLAFVCECIGATLACTLVLIPIAIHFFVLGLFLAFVPIVCIILMPAVVGVSAVIAAFFTAIAKLFHRLFMQ